jgi:hypothetical protein
MYLTKIKINWYSRYHVTENYQYRSPALWWGMSIWLWGNRLLIDFFQFKIVSESTPLVVFFIAIKSKKSSSFWCPDENSKII